MITLTQKTAEQILLFFMSTDYTHSRVTIAEYDLNEQNLTLYIEDKQDFKSQLDQCLIIEVPVTELAYFIDKGNYNKYEGRKASRSGRVFDGLVKIDEPLNWLNNDATKFQITTVNEDLVKAIFEQVIAA